MWRFETFLLVVFSFLFVPAKADFVEFFQNSEPNSKIDSLVNEARNVYLKEDYKKALELYQIVEKISKKENYSKGLVNAYLGISGIYFYKSDLQQATSYLLKAKSEPFASQDLNAEITILFWEGLNLHKLGLYDDAICKYKNAINTSQQIKDPIDRINKIHSGNVNIGDAYHLKNQKDSALYYYKSAFNTPDTDDLTKYTSALSLAEVYIDQTNLDSAKVYLNRAELYSKNLEGNYVLALLNEINGRYFLASGSYQNAILSFQESLELYQKMNRSRTRLYKYISEAYQKKGNLDQSNAYLLQYVEKRDSLDQQRVENLKVPAMLAQTDGELKVEEAKNRALIVFILIGILIGGIFISVFMYLKKQRKKSIKGKKENIQLKKKLNNAFEEVVALANLNSPNFLSRFIEVYPEFYSQLIQDYPDLTTADLKLCALMKLDFSTKEIAEISFSSVRTVQNRKYKLRKKFLLNSDENLNQWIQNFHVDSLVLN